MRLALSFVSFSNPAPQFELGSSPPQPDAYAMAAHMIPSEEEDCDCALLGPPFSTGKRTWKDVFHGLKALIN